MGRYRSDRNRCHRQSRRRKRLGRTKENRRSFFLRHNKINRHKQQKIQKEKQISRRRYRRNTGFKDHLISAKKYKCKNQFMQPKKGHIYYRMEFEFENKGDTDQTISSMTSWNCYADGYAADAAYAVADDEIDATISPGNKATGAVYYEIPKNSKKITLEFETNFWSQDKIVFVSKNK